MKVFLLLLVVIAGVAAHTTPTPPGTDVVIKRCTRYQKQLNKKKCSENAAFTPCHADSMDAKMWKSKCGKAWRKLKKLSYSYPINCPDPQKTCHHKKGI